MKGQLSKSIQYSLLLDFDLDLAVLPKYANILPPVWRMNLISCFHDNIPHHVFHFEWRVYFVIVLVVFLLYLFTQTTPYCSLKGWIHKKVKV